MDMNYLDTKFGLMESIMRNTLQKIKNLSSKMDMFTDRLVTVERKMLHFERELHIVKLQQSSSGKQPQHRLPPKYVPQHTALPPLPIYNPYFVRPRPVPPLRPNRTTNQPPITQSASSHQLPAPVPPIVNPDHPPSHSISHSSVDPPDHTSANPPGNSSAQLPHDPPAHIQHHPYNDSPNPETKDSPHSPVIDVLRTETTRPKRARHSSTDTELCSVMISPVFEPRLKNRKVLTSPVDDIFESDILPRLDNDFSNWT